LIKRFPGFLIMTVPPIISLSHPTPHGGQLSRGYISSVSDLGRDWMHTVHCISPEIRTSKKHEKYTSNKMQVKEVPR
jgi:hypothetical protein